MIPVGMQVRISEMGKAVFRHTEDNPHDLIGVVLENERKTSNGHFALDCLVSWSNSLGNTYNYEHLEVLCDLSHKLLEDYL